MFRTGRRSTTLLRATAGVGVALMLVGLYRPGFALTTVDVAKGAAPAATPGVTAPTAAPVASERVRSAIVPVAVKLDKGAMGVDPWVLFDGDGTTVFQTGQPLRVRVSLPKGVALETIGIYGGKGAVVSASVDGSSGVKPIAGLERAALDGLAARWNRFSAKAPVETSVLLLDITPAPGQRAEVPELELWGRAAPSARPSSSRAWAEALLTHLPAGAVQSAASPSSATIAAPQVGPAGHVPLTFDLDRAPRMFERAFLVYELEGLAHWSAVVRRVNWNAPQGGFHAVGVARHGLQVEEISPDWLRQGRNELQFLVSDRNDLAGYKVKNLRVVGVPAAGNQAARPQIDTPRADKIAAALVDGSRETGLTNKDLRKPQTVDFRFAETTQLDSLLVAVEKGAKGTLSAQAIVRGTVDPTSQVGAELDQLGTGWARLPLDSLPAEADGIRVTLRGARGESSGGLVSELRVTGSRLPTRRVSSLTVTYPLHGECVDGEAYVRGFLRGDASGSTKGATLRIAGATRPEALKWDGSFSAVVQPPGAALRRGGKWQVEIEARFANGDATGAAVDIEGCREPVVASKKTGPREDEGAPFGQIVRAGESAKLAFAGATLEIPAGALDNDTRITIRPLSDVEIPATDETLTNVTAGGRAYRLGPHGLKFGKPIALTIPFDRSRFVGGQAEDDMGAYFFDEDAKRWRQVQTLRGDASKQTLAAATTHFTDFIAGTISSPDHPTADSFNPNSIKDMKAASPTAGIDLIQPPEPSPDGATHLSFPLWVPPGRHGMQPNLAVTYSSDAGNGLMGVGWSLPISTIEVDTRFGTPRYSQTEETETYSIDGELLVIDPGQPIRGPKTFFHRKAEGKFDTIIRRGGSPIEVFNPSGDPIACHWEVVDKGGTHFFYGETHSARGSAVLRGVFRWYLTRVVDAFGNQIIYTYDKTFPVLHQTLDTATVSVLLKTIQYTADSAGQNAHYRVEFEYDGNPDGFDNLIKAQRRDIFTNARGGTLEVVNRRLARIQVYENPKVGFDNIRRYDFPYFFGDFGKVLLKEILVAQGRPTTFEANGNDFYKHTFEYMALDANAFDAPVEWTGSVPSNAGLSRAESASMNGTAMAGWGPGGCSTFHGVTGGSTSLSLPIPLPDSIPNRNDDVAMRGLIDVNGDGLPDLVGDTGVLLNRGDASYSGAPRTFVTGLPSHTPPGSIVNHSKRSSTGLSTGVHILNEAAHSGLGWSWGSNGDDTTMADIDGDGFVDYLRSSGNFQLNTHQQGFGAGSVGWGTLPATKQMTQEAIDKQKDLFYLTEPTVLWVAPFSGHVEIAATAQKVADVSPDSDGVRLFFDQYRPTPDAQGNPTNSVKLEMNSWTGIMTGTTLCGIPEAPQTNGCTTSGGRRHIFVKKNDRLYFRASARNDIDDDAILWNPTIKYDDTSDDLGNNVVPLSTLQRTMPEPFGGSAYGFQQLTDMRLAGKPTPTWRNDSAGTQTVTVRITSTGNIKRRTSDAVTLEVMRAPNGNFAAAQAIAAIPGFQSSYPAGDNDVPVAITPLNFTHPLQPNDRIFFRVSSPTPIDPEQIDWNPHIEYVTYCRHDSVPPQASDFSQQTVVCGDVINCASSAGGGFCQLRNDPNPNATIALSTLRQDISPYFELLPWHQFGVPVAFFPPSNGTVTVTGRYRGSLPARLVARGLQRLAGSTPMGASPVLFSPTPSMTFPVFANSPILFDAFIDGVNAPNPDTIVDGSSWEPTVVFNGANTPLVARRNYRTTQEDTGAGRFHNWTQFEWNVTDPVTGLFNDLLAKRLLSQGFNANEINQNTQKTVLPVTQMRQAPLGIQQLAPTGPALIVPGPLWAGNSTDGYIGEGKFKPSRTGRPMTGAAVTFSNTSTTSTDLGAFALFQGAVDFSKAETNFELVDLNGDNYPDLVSNSGIRFNRPKFATMPDTSLDRTIATEGTFDQTETPFRDSNNVNAPLENLALVDGRNVSSSLGISSMVATYIRASKGAEAPSWVSLLPTIGIGYGNAQTIELMTDINGDGLPDAVGRKDNGDLIVRLNLGHRIGGEGYQFTGGMIYNAATWSQTTVPRPSISGSALGLLPGNFQTAVTDFMAAINPLTGFRKLRLDALRLQNSAANNIGAGYSYFGGNLTASVSRTLTDMIDINGDGLPDMVMRMPNEQMVVKFNFGDDFGPETLWTMPAWPVADNFLHQAQTFGFGGNDALAFTETTGNSKSAGFPYYFETVYAGCWGGEVGIGSGLNSVGSEMRFQDMDGDGAPDHVLKVNGESKIYVRKNAANNHSGAKPNLLRKVNNPLGGGFELAYRQLGNVVDRDRHVDMPHSQFALILIDVFSSSAGNPIQDVHNSTLIDYGITPSNPGQPTSIPSGFYDRGTREFLGYSRLTITRGGDGRQIQREYDNTSYARKHMLLNEQTRDLSFNGGVLYTRTVRTPLDRDVVVPGTTTVIPGAKFAFVTAERTFFYEGLTTDPADFKKSSQRGYDYDAAGNLSTFDDLGDDDPAVLDDDVHYAIGYQSIVEPATETTFPRPNNVVARDAGQNILRHRFASYGSRGQMLSTHDNLFGGKDPVTGQTYVISQSPNPTSIFTYNGFGNIETATAPDGYALTYTYEPTQTHVQTITDSFGLQSRRDYDMKFGAPSDTKDVNGQRTHTRYDVFGRADRFCGPGDVVTGNTPSGFDCSALPTIALSYAIASAAQGGGTVNDGAAPFYAFTKHRDVGRVPPTNDTLDTVIFVDGLGRVRQTKTDSFVGGAERRTLTGRVTFDGVGRVYQEGFAELDNTSQQKVFAPWLPNPRFAKTTAYDILDRVRTVQTPDDRGTVVAPDGGKVVATSISFDPKVLDGRMQLTTTVKDAQDKLRTQYLSPRGDILAVSEVNRVGTAFPTGAPTVLTTRYKHDPLSQLTQVRDPAENVTTAKYDSIGHMVELISPDAGKTEWRYDGPGRLAAKETANLRAKGQFVRYTYNRNRLTTITYPTGPNATFPVAYTYGDPGASLNRAGRIWKVEDESGIETRNFDALGNVSHMEKTPRTMSSSIPGVNYKMDYTYDLFGRVLNMKYPDGGEVKYEYDAGGLVNKVTGTRKGVTTTYVNNLVYNERGQRTGLTLGNGWNSIYVYQDDTKRLGKVVTTRVTAKIQDVAYAYDLVGNIVSISNNLPTLPPVPPNTVIAPGPTTQFFAYDDLYQLTNSSGFYAGCACGCDNTRRYSLTTQYDGIGNIIRKNQTDSITKPSGQVTPQVATTYNNAYTYGGTRPHAPTAVGGTTSTSITYDDDGNQTQYSGNFGPSRSLTWSEDDRLRSETDSGFTSTFLYDAGGNRSHKRRTTLETWYVNPNYVVKNSLAESRHILLGSDRIVTEVATITNRADPTTAGASTLFYYHPDHLQSTSYVTGADGSILQHDEYFPGGEVWFQEQKNNDARNTQPYLFNAKELDETGLYYFGARYYNPKLSVWTGPDPILSAYMRGQVNNGVFQPRNLGLYSYAANNPIGLRDLDGTHFSPYMMPNWEFIASDPDRSRQALVGVVIGGAIGLLCFVPQLIPPAMGFAARHPNLIQGINQLGQGPGVILPTVPVALAAQQLEAGIAGNAPKLVPQLSQLRLLRNFGLDKFARRQFFTNETGAAFYATTTANPVAYAKLAGGQLETGIISIVKAEGKGVSAFMQFVGASRDLARSFGLESVDVAGVAIKNTELGLRMLRSGFRPFVLKVPDMIGGGSAPGLIKRFHLR